MRTLIITVAGTATRFNQDIECKTLKCLYYVGSPKHSLLYQILNKARDIEEIIIVGGYLYEELIAFTDQYLGEFKNQLKMVYNSHYIDFGSGYSLLKGIENITEGTTEILFVEGDLYFDINSFALVKSSLRDVITINHECITSHKAVALYVDDSNYIHYIYDKNHQLLYIPIPFKSIYNSGQIWKFVSLDKLKKIISILSPIQKEGTNLEIIQAYFKNIPLAKLDLIPMEIWFNCNTITDYKQLYAYIEQ